jgi:hypothetical protein
MRYVDAVTGAYHLLTSQDTDENTGDVEDQGRLTSCIEFGIGAITAAPEDIASLRETLNPDQNKAKQSEQRTSDKRTKVAEVHVYFWHDDPGPKAYVTRLAEQRRNWFVGKLTEIGYTQDQIVISELSSRKQSEKLCGSEVSASGVAIEVRQSNGGEER